MNKLLILAVFVAVASAACKPKTCKACTNSNWSSNKKCASLSNVKKPAAQCVKTLKDAQICADCRAFVKCKKAEKAKADKALQDKYTKLCPTNRAQCVDVSPSCIAWANNNPSQCTSNPDWMLPNCARSCCPLCTGRNTLGTSKCPPKDRFDLCVSDSRAPGVTCEAWAKKATKGKKKGKSECDTNKDWMIPNCMQSCCKHCQYDKDKCPTIKKLCKNSYTTGKGKKAAKQKAGNEKCEAWAKAGECTRNAKWMRSNCSRECCPVCRAIAPGPSPVVNRALPQVFRQPAFGGYATPAFGGLPYQG